MSTMTRCDLCSNEVLPGHYQVKVKTRVHDLCPTCEDKLAAWLNAPAEPVPAMAAEPELPAKKAKRHHA
jgi:hypothetical protein